jgi:hypothetical protein
MTIPRPAARPRLSLLCALVLPAVTQAADGFRELTIRLDHPVDAAPIDMRLADGSGIVAMGRDEGAWRYSIVSLTDGTVAATGDVPPDAIFYDTGDLTGDGTDQLLFFTERGIKALAPGADAPQPVAAFESIYHARSNRSLPHSDFARDVDGDGADDLLVPQFEGWLVARRAGDSFQHSLLEILPQVEVFETRVSYRPRVPREGDVDGDGRQDLVFLRDKEFVSFVQLEGGGFETTARRDAIASPLASEEELALWERDDGQIDQSDLQVEEVELVQDFTDDGIPDLLTDKSISEGVLDRRSEYHLYIGRRENGALVYGAAPDGSIRSDGVQFDPLVVDVDGDGRMDLATPSTQLGLTRIVAALFSGKMGVDLDVYRMRPDGTYPEDSDYRTRFKVEFDLKTGLVRNPAVAIADFDGDGAAELLLQEEDDALSLFPGRKDDELFGDEARTVKLPLPRNGIMVEARDLDGDERADLLVRYGPADGAERLGELRILLSVPAG